MRFASPPQVHKFSKFIHGTCTLFPELVQAVPYWVDDESVRPSMLLSAPPAASGNGASTSVQVVTRDGVEEEVRGGELLDAFEYACHPPATCFACCV